jgi:AraC-like DNA-binding protein
MSLFNYFKDIISKFRLNDPTSKTVFDHYFFDLKYYLHQETSSDEFSILLNISSEKLDQITYQNYGSSFQNLVNECRYRHVLEEMESPINSNLSIESIVRLSGFKDNDNFVDFIKTKEGNSLNNNELKTNNYKNLKSS